MTITSGSVRVKTPASSANLGPGFDAFGLALQLFDEVEVEVVGSGISVEVQGEGAETVATDDKNLIAQTILQTLDVIGTSVAGLKITAHNAIPHGRGLGSSSAAIVGAIAAARALAGDIGAHFDDADAFQLAVEIEGHPDNVAAAMFGGFVISWMEGGAAKAAKFDSVVQPSVFIPSQPVATKVARALLPESIPHQDAAWNSARAGLLGLAMTNRPELLLSATEDRLHQSYRSEAMPDSYRLMRNLRLEMIPAVISGAGPSVLAFARGLNDFISPDWRYLELDVSPTGALIQ